MADLLDEYLGKKREKERNLYKISTGLYFNTSWDLDGLLSSNTTEDESNPFYDDADLCLNYLKRERVAQ